jgi:hypothetical protein
LATSSASLETSASFPSLAGYSNSLWHSRVLLPGLHTFRTFTAVLSRIAICSFRRESGTCTPPFFRTSAGHRVEGRNPWHLQCSHNQLPVGTQFRRLVRSLSLRPSWWLASWADQTEYVLSLPKASTSGLPALKSPQGLPDMTTAPNGELRRQDFHLQVQQLVSLRSLLICHAMFNVRVRAMEERAIPSLSHCLVRTTYRLAPLPCLDWQWMIHRTALVTTKIRLSL